MRIKSQIPSSKSQTNSKPQIPNIHEIKHSLFGNWNLCIFCDLVIVICVLFSPVFAAEELSLKQAVEIALKKNPQITAGKEQINAASARMGQAGSYALPQLGFSGSLGKNYSQPMTINLPDIFGGGTIQTTPDEAADISSYNFSVTQNLFAGGRIITGMSVAKINYDISQQNFKSTQNNVAFNAKVAYFEVVKSKKLLQLVEESLSNMRRNLAQTQVFFDSGIAPYTDVLRAQTSVANMEIQKIKVDTMINVNLLTLEDALDQRLPKDIILDESVLTRGYTSEVTMDEVLKKAYIFRPDWLAFQLGLKTASDSIALAYSGYLPSVMFQYSFGRNKSDYQNAKLLYDLGNWRSVIAASWTLFDGLNTPNKVREAYALLNSAKATEIQIRNGIELEVSSVYLNLEAAAKTLVASQVAADLAERAYKATEVNYKAGIASEQYYLDAQNAYLNAKVNLYAAQTGLEVEKARLNKVVGTNVIKANI